MGDSGLKHPWLRALGREEMPARIETGGGLYRHLKTYKHDFFAATGLYEGSAGRAILKLGRVSRLLGLPTAWIGVWLSRRERRIYDAVDDLEGVPRCLGSWSRTGFLHAFVPGHPLQRQERVADDFFPRLEALIDALHARGLAYADLEKRENILVGDDGNPYLIDFQISWYWPEQRHQGRPWWIPGFLGRLILRRLQQADRYHLLKHRRRHRPDTLTDEQIRASYEVGFWITLHRWFFRPLTLIRRAMLKKLTGRARSPKQEGPEFLTDPDSAARSDSEGQRNASHGGT